MQSEMVATLLFGNDTGNTAGDLVKFCTIALILQL